MATVPKSGTPSLSTVTPCHAHQITGLVAGEALTVGDPCYIKSDGKVWRSIGTTADAAAEVDGWCLQAAAVGEGVSLYNDVNLRYGSGMTPGKRLYLSLTAGTLQDAVSAGGTKPIGMVIDATRIRVWRSRY